MRLGPGLVPRAYSAQIIFGLIPSPSGLGLSLAARPSGPCIHSEFAASFLFPLATGQPLSETCAGVSVAGWSRNSRSLRFLHLNENVFTFNSYGVNCNFFLRVLRGSGRGIEGPGMPGTNQLAVFDHAFG